MKILPWAIAGLVFIAILIGVFIFIPGEVEVPTHLGEFFEECHTANNDLASLIDALEANDLDGCTGQAAELCTAVITQDESLCPPDSSCKAYVRKDASACGDDFECEAYLMKDSSKCTGFDELEDLDLYNNCVAMAERNSDYFTSRQADVNCVDSARFWNAEVVEDCVDIEHNELKEHCTLMVQGLGEDRKTQVFDVPIDE